jgi:Uma2 family endonuclease
MSAQPFDEAAEVRVSWEEFLRFQQAYTGPERMDWDNGLIVRAMTGGSERHDLVVMALIEQLFRVLPERCVVFAHNRQVKTPSQRSYHPDLLVRCGKAAHQLYEEDARLIVEVLSPSNGPAEQTAKLYAYQQLPSIEAIFFVNTVRRIVTVHRKHPDGSGWMESQTRDGAISSGGITLDFGAMWSWVDERSTFE